MSLSENIKNLRKEKGLSQQGLADAIYVSRSTVAKWENGLGIPSDANLAEMAAYFKVMEYEITGEPSEWEKERERIKKTDRMYKIRFFAFAATALAVLALCLYLLLCIPYIKRSTKKFSHPQVVTTSGQQVELEIVKQAAPFSKGEVCVWDYSGDYLPDEITFKNGAINHTYRVTYIYISYVKNDVLYVPSDAIILNTDYENAVRNGNFQSSYYNSNEFSKITVSPKNTLYDSREDCNCLIETKTNRILKGCTTSTIPSTVTEIASYAFYFRYDGPEEIVIPGTVKKVCDNAFYYPRLITEEKLPITIEEGVEELESGCFIDFYYQDYYILPSSIKKLGNIDYAHGCKILYYNGSKEDFLNITFVDYEQKEEGKEFYDSVSETDTFNGMKVYYYSYYEPKDAENLWHYDANGNPVLWSEEN